MKILVCGSRSANSDEQNRFIFEQLDRLINKKDDFIITGRAVGVDDIVEHWCVKNNVLNIIVRPIDKTKRQDYLYRNIEMITMCDKVIGFWDEKSRGTKFTLDYATARNKLVIIIKI
jgi:hypothetical protein